MRVYMTLVKIKGFREVNFATSKTLSVKNMHFRLLLMGKHIIRVNVS